MGTWRLCQGSEKKNEKTNNSRQDNINNCTWVGFKILKNDFK